ncbi:MAG: hypothetical protein JNJ75_05365 [Cyclobacteriaceae bacterium]|nr:hypothetical protein [Cyclobacteriaceae bacterium]
MISSILIYTLLRLVDILDFKYSFDFGQSNVRFSLWDNSHRVWHGLDQMSVVDFALFSQFK